tara:strand:+ start:1733 stop:1879 length:147 start_codon:yes stop_codon:yes gene_type:complete
MVDHLDKDDVHLILQQFRDSNLDSNVIYEVEKYDKPEKIRLGRDPDLH